MLERRVEDLVANRPRRSDNHFNQAPAASAELLTREGSSSANSDSFPCHTFAGASSPSVNTVLYIPSLDGGSNIAPTTMNTDVDIGDVIDHGLVSMEFARVLLSRFRGRAAEHFPFVVVHHSTTLGLLRRDTPFLFLAIMAAMAFDNPELQRRLGEEVRTQVFRRMLIRCEKSLELLQGLLIYAAYHFYFYRREKQQVFLISQLCVTLAQDLGIDKSVGRLVDLGVSNPDQETSSSPNLRNAQMRAFLGTYCLSSS